MGRKTLIILIITAAVLSASIIFSLSSGSYSLGIDEIIGTLIGRGNPLSNTIVMQLRLPRIFIAILVGASLSTAGCILQSILGNPLAEPGIIGMNSGAALAVVLLISSSSSAYYDSIGIYTMMLLPIASIAGSFLVTSLIYVLSVKKGANPARLTLTGVGISAGINAFIALYQLTMSKGDYNRALTWISGSLWGSNWLFVGIIAPAAAVSIGFAMYNSKLLDVIRLGRETAVGLGVDVDKKQKSLLGIALVLSAASTAVAGNISFLGLMGPHIANRLVGPVHIRKIPVAAGISSVLILLADTASRTMFSPLEMPVGITVSILGVPYFIYLMLKEA